MGLDTIELIAAVEESFDIRLEDWECHRVRTVGDLHRLVLAKLEQPQPRLPGTVACTHVPAFNRMRRALTETVGIDRSSVRLETRVRDLLAARGRQRVWARLSNHSKLRLPELRVPSWLLGAAVLVAVAAPAWGYWKFGIGSLVLFPLMALGLFALTMAATRPWHAALPQGIETVGDLTRSVAGLNYVRLTRGRKVYTSGDVWGALVEIIIEQIGIERSKIQPDASFAEDLKLD